MSNDQSPYWNRVAELKTFTHPLRQDWLEGRVARDGAWLDYGCGYGRNCRELESRGWPNTTGVDFSSAMLERAQREHPSGTYRLAKELDEAQQFDVVLLFAVWTCIPEEEQLSALMGRVRRLLRPGGLLYLSDMLLQEDERYRARYRASAHEPWGCFELEEGARLRHFDLDSIETHLRGFECLEFEPFEVTTMNGNAARAFQFLGRRGEAQDTPSLPRNQ